jgi:hypothetical protein
LFALDFYDLEWKLGKGEGNASGIYLSEKLGIAIVSFMALKLLPVRIQNDLPDSGLLYTYTVVRKTLCWVEIEDEEKVASLKRNHLITLML